MGTVYMNENDVPDIRRSPWVDNFFRPLMIVTMIMCVNFSLVNLVRLINPGWNGTYFLLGMLLTTVEAIYSYRVLKHWRSRGISLFRYRLAELIVLILLLKLLNFAGKSISQIWTELQLMWHDPLDFITIEFYIVLTLALIAWMAATYTIADFEALYDPYTFRTDSILPLNDLRSRFFWGGIALVFISGISHTAIRSGFTSLTNLQRPSLGGIIVNVLLYFTLGLVLLSQANLTRLLVRWRVQKISVAPDMVKQWGKYALAFLSLTTLIVFFLPTGYTLGFLASVAVIIQYLVELLAFILQLLAFLILLPFAWLFSLMDQTTLEGSFSPPAPPPELTPPADSGSIPWLDAVRSLVFWLLGMAMVGYLLRVYLADHPNLIPALKKLRLLGLLIKLLEQMWQQLRVLARTGLELFPTAAAPQHKDEAASPAWGQNLFKFGRLSPRQRILYYYRNVLKRVAGQERAHQRRKHQTPYEYEPELGQTVPDSQVAVNELTEAFVHARYSSAVFDGDEAAVVKQKWQQIKRELKKRKAGDSSS